MNVSKTSNASVPPKAQKAAPTVPPPKPNENGAQNGVKAAQQEAQKAAAAKEKSQPENAGNRGTAKGGEINITA